MDAFAERMQQLRIRFAERALCERDELQTALSAGDHATAIRILHSLAGNAGLFGHPELGDAARDLEQALERGAGDGETRTMVQRLMQQFPSAGAGAAQ